ncbi:hypothetical protein DFH08DRAFT_708129 [Mycena albidolilacea]|uniref:Uncharacterized protein n=1 Tax=Mycena albidolilacea TaxID=1033008 RepID=A0AAD6ZPN8_9AGAR|nr:hypothetical protein DFH08DRAFT_708129 [Mycena albidolilacea]
MERRIAFPAFEHSVFTTCDIIFNDTFSSRINYETVFDTMEAFTVMGSYDHTKGGHIVCWDDHTMIELRPGSTVLLAAGCKQFSFTATGPGETQFLFRQYCDASIMRWLHKRGHSDGEFEQLQGSAEIAMWEEARANRGCAALGMFSQLQDLFALS